MQLFVKHITRCLLAGIVAVLPIGGLVLTIGYLESMISGAGLTHLPFYFPGLGLLLALLALYLIGLVLTTVIGKWLWRRIDRLIDSLPALGTLYSTLKQILGYGEGKDAVFQSAVIVSAPGDAGEEFGLVTNRIRLADGRERVLVFIPGSPNPTTGRLLVAPPENIRATDMPVNEVFKALVAVGKTDIDIR